MVRQRWRRLKPRIYYTLHALTWAKIVFHFGCCKLLPCCRPINYPMFWVGIYIFCVNMRFGIDFVVGVVVMWWQCCFLLLLLPIRLRFSFRICLNELWYRRKCFWLLFWFVLIFHSKPTRQKSPERAAPRVGDTHTKRPKMTKNIQDKSEIPSNVDDGIWWPRTIEWTRIREKEKLKSTTRYGCVTHTQNLHETWKV